MIRDLQHVTYSTYSAINHFKYTQSNICGRKNDIFNVSSDMTWLFFEPMNLKTISFIQNELLK